MLVGGMRPHAYCLPVAKREKHRLALRKLATSGHDRVFLGTDTAPHARHLKESACGCAGLFNAPYALESYIAVFDEEGALDKFEAFASENGPRFYGLPLNEGTVTLEKSGVTVPAEIAAGAPCWCRSMPAKRWPGAWNGGESLNGGGEDQRRAQRRSRLNSPIAAQISTKQVTRAGSSGSP
jgi:dihydroorotase